MDHIAFETRKSAVEDYKVTDIYINGVNLAALARPIEFSYLQRINASDLAGLYEGLPPLMVLPPSRHFFGEPAKEYLYPGGKVGLLEYGASGVPGEYALAAIIEVEENIITWREFEHFSTCLPVPAIKWNYKSLGDLIFERRQYENALVAAKRLAY